MRALWNDAVIAESDATVVIEGNHYVPPDSITPGALIATGATSTCPWKGTADYHTVTAGGRENPDSAWSYPTPKDAAAEIKDHVAFWNGISVVE